MTEPLVKSPGLLHHMILFACTTTPLGTPGDLFDCASMDNNCTSFAV